MEEESSRRRPTPTENTQSLRPGDFSTLAEALDYAAQGATGCNFYNGRGALYVSLTYRDLRDQALALARRLLGLGLERGARVALVADTHPDFHRFFFACQYAGLVPVPLPCSKRLGNRRSYLGQLRALLVHCRAAIAMAPSGLVPFLTEAAEGLDLRMLGGSEDYAALPEAPRELDPLKPMELAYIQYTSGSTRFPRGVMMTQQAVLANLLSIITHGLAVRPGDRCVSWLPFSHDMGLVGFVLGPMASQLSVDYLDAWDFAVRPRQWLWLMAQTRATISFSPSFGYELCVRRVRRGEAEKFDLSAWRAAGVGGEPIRPQRLRQFAELVSPSGFNEKAFLPCYGMAECALAVSFPPLGRGLEVDEVDSNHLGERQQALSASPVLAGHHALHTVSLVKCGHPLPGVQVEVRDEQGRKLSERQCGTLYVRGPGVMCGYFSDPEATEETLSPDGWLDTGDIGYRVGSDIVLTGRRKDLIILNGQNIWPLDLEGVAERLPEVKSGDAAAFSVIGPDHDEIAVMVVQCRETDAAKREDLMKGLRGMIREERGIECVIEFVSLHTLPRTSSGKLSRSRAREDFLKRVDWEHVDDSSREQSDSYSGLVDW